MKTCGPPLLLGVQKIQKEVWVCVTVFKRKIGTMPLGYFSLVALYYCKICHNYTPERKINNQIKAKILALLSADFVASNTT